MYGARRRWLPRRGADGAHLVGHVSEVTGPDAADGLVLGRTLHLEDADGVGPVEHFVDLGVLEAGAGEVAAPPIRYKQHYADLRHQVLVILQRAREALDHGGRLNVVETVLDEGDASGGLLDLNMLVMTGGRERTQRQFRDC